MTFHPDASPPRRRSRGRTRPDRLHASAPVRDADGVLVLYAEGGAPDPRCTQKESMPEDAVSTSLLAEYDAALEEIAYLKEQLGSLSAYHTHLLDEERRRMFDERTQLASELASLREALQRRTLPGVMATSSAGAPPTSAPDGNITGTR